jgi:hypothetical protein
MLAHVEYDYNYKVDYEKKEKNNVVRCVKFCISFVDRANC